jgi:vancomycin permeability regulator SanA
MTRKLTLLLRPFGAAFGVFIVLNLALALQKPILSATRIWLPFHLDEPGLSLFAGLLGLALLLPHSMGRLPWTRWLLGGVFLGFAILVGAGTLIYYESLYRRNFSSDFPVPLSAFLCLVLVSEFLRITSWRPREHRAPPPARVFFNMLSMGGAFLVITLIHVVTFGHTDHRREADAAVIFGAKIYSDGSPCAALVDRLDTGIDLYDQGFVDTLIMTGARDPNGQSEPAVMKRYAQARGVPPRRILIDESGVNTRASASNVGKMAREAGLERLLAVTQYFHCARVKLTFDREGVSCATVPTCSSQRSGTTPAKLSRETFFLFREAIAFPFYLLYHR